MVEVIGYILVAVSITSNGDVEGKALDYFNDNVVCYMEAVEHERQADPGIGFVCLEDFINGKES